MSGHRFLREWGLVFEKEVVTLARDRHTIIYSVFIPLFLYPALVWMLLQIAVYLKGLEEVLTSRVLVVGVGPDDPFAASLTADTGLCILWSGKSDRSEAGAGAGKGLQFTGRGDEADAALARRTIEEGSADAVIIISAAAGSRASTEPRPVGNRTIRAFYSRAMDASSRAARRIERAAREYRAERLKDLARAATGDESFLNVLDVGEVDVASREELTNYVASMILPLLMVIMTAFGALYPALDSTVGERERGTLETTLVCPVSRLSLVLGKYSAVVLFSLLAFILNFGSMGFTLEHLRGQFRMESFHVRLDATLVLLGSAVLLALLLSAVMMLLAFMARSFREGQALVTPVYLLAVIPALITSSPDTEVTLIMAVIPVVNVSLLFREVLQSKTSVPYLVVTLASSTVWVLLALLTASRMLRRESLVTGSRPAPGDIQRAVDERRSAGGGPPVSLAGESRGAGKEKK